VKPFIAPVPDAHRFALFPDGKRVAVRNELGVIRVHDLRTGRQLDEHSTFARLGGVKMTGPRTATAWTADGVLATWDVRTGRMVSAQRRIDPSPGHRFESLRFAQDDAHVAGETAAGWVFAEAKTGKVLKRIAAVPRQEYYPTPENVLLQRGGRGLHVSGRYTDDDLLQVTLTDLTGRRPPRDVTLEVNWRGGSHMFSPDGRCLLVATWDHAYLCDAATGAVRWEARLSHEKIREGEQRSYAIVFDRRGRQVAVSHGYDVTVFDVLTGRRLVALREATFDHAAFSASGRGWPPSAAGSSASGTCTPNTPRPRPSTAPSPRGRSASTSTTTPR
jgi:hypothetical protein